jgi:hypothetical protein
VLPVLLAPASAANVVFAFVPVSNSFQPVGNVEEVPEVMRVLKFWVYGAAVDVIITCPVNFEADNRQKNANGIRV